MSEQNSKESANEEALNQIKDEAGRKYDHSKLTINRVPDKTIEKLQELSYDRFAGDYGLTLAYLIEINELRDEFASMTQPLNKKVNELESEIGELKQKIIEEENQEENGSKVDTIG